jgi:phosphomannomutase
MLSKNPGDTATNLSSSRAADDITAKYGKTCHRSAVGEINVVKVMQQKGAVIGGEGNGGVINPDLHPGRDALAGTAMMLQLLAERDISASEYRNTLPDYEMSKQKIELRDLGYDADDLLKKLNLNLPNIIPIPPTESKLISMMAGCISVNRTLNRL